MVLVSDCLSSCKMREEGACAQSCRLHFRRKRGSSFGRNLQSTNGGRHTRPSVLCASHEKAPGLRQGVWSPRCALARSFTFAEVFKICSPFAKFQLRFRRIWLCVCLPDQKRLRAIRDISGTCRCYTLASFSRYSPPCRWRRAPSSALSLVQICFPLFRYMKSKPESLGYALNMSGGSFGVSPLTSTEAHARSRTALLRGRANSG